MARTGENIYKRKDGRWEARYIASYDEFGKAKYKYLYSRTYKGVKEKLINAQNHSATFIRQGESTGKYKYWLAEWLQTKRISVKESSYIRYRNLILNHITPSLGNYPISKISTELMKKYAHDQLISGRIDGKGGLSPKTMTDIFVIIKESFKYAQSQGAYTQCSFEHIAFKKSKQEMRVLNPNEEQRLLSVLFDDIDRYKLGVFICLYTGIRIGELCALQWKDISISDKTVKIERTMQRLQNKEKDSFTKTTVIITEPKSDCAKRTIPLPDFVIEAIIPFVASPTSFVLSGGCKAYVEPRTMQNHFKAYLEKGCIDDANFHALRHTFATRCVEVGFDIKSLSEILGHSSVKITLDRYVHSSMELKRNNMEKLKPLM